MQSALPSMRGCSGVSSRVGRPSGFGKSRAVHGCRRRLAVAVDDVQSQISVTLCYRASICVLALQPMRIARWDCRRKTLLLLLLLQPLLRFVAARQTLVRSARRCCALPLLLLLL